jgi:hypothetical protein
MHAGIDSMCYARRKVADAKRLYPRAAKSFSTHSVVIHTQCDAFVTFFYAAVESIQRNAVDP